MTALAVKETYARAKMISGKTSGIGEEKRIESGRNKAQGTSGARKIGRKEVAGRVGFEPTDTGTKIRGLTTWRPANLRRYSCTIHQISASSDFFSRIIYLCTFPIPPDLSLQ